MKKIGLLLRVDKFGKYKETRDNIDTRFIYLFQKLNFEPILIPTSIKNIELFIAKMSLDGIILSPGGNPLKNDIRKKNEFKIIKYCIKKKIPILGICRGAQIINLYFKGTLKKVKNHVRKNHQIFGNIIKNKKIKVNSYHDLGFDKKMLGRNLIVNAFSKDQVIECFSHKKFNILGLMWHPERNKKINLFDINIIKSFF